MARLARLNSESSYLHIMVQGISKEYIFSKNTYKEKYMSLINTYIKEYDIQLFVYCIIGNHAHLLVHINTIEEISSFMYKINGMYAIYYNNQFKNRVGHVFRNRFKSESVCDQRYLNNCIKYIHNNPVKANIVGNPIDYTFSSYKDYYYKNGLTVNSHLKKIVDFSFVLNNQLQVEENFIDIDRDIEFIIENIKIKINNKDMYVEDKIKEIERIKKEYNIPYKRIYKIFNLSERTFRRKKKNMAVFMSVPKTDKEEKYEI